jgi:protein transport protein SEC9
MGKFSLKRGDGDEDSSRLALFGNRSKSKSPAPPSHNPYAQPTIPPDPYTQAKMNAGIIPRPGPPQGQGTGAPPPAGGYGGLGQPPDSRASYNSDNRFGAPQAGYAGANGYGGAPPSGNYGRDHKYGPSGGGPPNDGNPYASISQTSGTSRYGPGG